MRGQHQHGWMASWRPLRLAPRRRARRSEEPAGRSAAPTSVQGCPGQGTDGLTWSLLACAVDRWSVRQVKAWRFLSRDQDHPAPHAGARSSLLSHRASGKRLQRARELGIGFEVVFAPTVSYRLTAPDLRRSEHHQRRRRAGSVALRSCITSIHLVITNHMWLEAVAEDAEKSRYGNIVVSLCVHGLLHHSMYATRSHPLRLHTLRLLHR